MPTYPFSQGGPESLTEVFVPCQSIARNSVQVNTRNNVRAQKSDPCYPAGMEKEWQKRFEARVEQDGRSARAISLAAGLGPNFVQQMLKTGREPGIDKFLAVLGVMGTSSALYVLTGQDFTEQDAEFLRLVGGMDPEMKAEALRFFQMLQARQGTPEPQPSVPSKE
jgi:hypothetical protein